jgi:hypothetical protein
MVRAYDSPKPGGYLGNVESEGGVMVGWVFAHYVEGPLAGLIGRIYRPRIEAGLAQMNGDLKRAAEAAAR